MNKILKFSAIALLASSTTLMAQMSGPSIGVSASGMRAKVSGSQGGNAPSASGEIERTLYVAAIDAEYTANLDKSWDISFGVSYIPFKGKIGDESRSDTDQQTAGGGAGTTTSTGTNSAKGELKNHYTFYIEPTYLLSKDSGIYGKVGYLYSDLEIKSSNITGSSLNKTINAEGWQAGLGYKTMVDKNTFVKFELSYSNYNKLSATSDSGNTFSADPEIYAATIAVGYKF